MSNATRILIVEDLSNDYELAQKEIRKIIKKCRFERVETQAEFLKALDEFQPDLILSDYSLPGFDGMKTLKLAQKHSPMVPVIIWTDVMGESIAVECLKKGASSYILKTDMQRLGPAVVRALEERNLFVERKRVESKYQLIFENAMEGIFQSTPDGRYLSVNPAMARIYGYSSPAEMIETVTDIPSQIYADPGARSQFVEMLLADEFIKDFEMKNLRKNGSMIWTSTSARAVRDEKGNVLYYEGFLQDITERKQAEEKLRESEERYRFLFENNPLPMWIYDLETLTFLRVNEAAVQHYGYSVDEFMSMTIKDIRPSEDVSALIEKILNTSEGINKSGQWNHCKRDGTLITVEIISHSVEFAGRKCELIVAIDITERVRSEKAEREQRALAEALRHTSEALNSTLDYGEVLDQILTTVGSVVPSDAATIMLIDKGNAHVVRSRGYKERGLDGKIMEVELSLDETANLHRMLETGKPVIIPDTRSFPNWQRVSAVDWIYSNVGAPISLHGEVIGFILLDSETPGFFTPLHAERLQAFANQAALAIHNSRLMQQAQEEIEARKQVEARVKDLLEFNEKIINHSPLGILTYKMTGECVFVNKNAASILGGSVDKLLAQNFNDIEPWKTSGMYELVQRAISTRSALTADVHHITTFGKDIWLRAHFSIFKSKTQDHILLTISDITEQRLAEDRLRESENRLILALSAAQMSVWEWNVENNKVLLSPEFYPITGIPESAFDGTFEGYIGFVHPEDVVRVRESAKEAIEKNTIYSEEFRIVLPSGEVRWLSNLGHIEYGHSNTSMRMIGTVQEITRRKRVEMEQQALLEIMQGLAQAVDLQELVELVHRSIGNVIFAENFFVVFHNRDTGLFEEIYSVDQYDPPALPSKLEKSITSYVFRTCEPLLVDQALFDELAAQGEVELVGTDSASWLGAPLKTLNETIGVIVVQDYQNPRRYSERDKSFLSSIATQVALALERKQAEQKVRESEERYRALFENSPISIWEEDFTDVFAWMEELRAMGVKDLRKFLEENLDEYKVGVSLIRVLNVNETAVVMNGAQNKQELLNILHELLIDKTLSPVMVHEFDMIWQGHTSFDFEMSSPRTDGSLVTGILHVYIPRKNGRPDYSHVIVTSTDITERVEIEKKLRTSELHYRELSDSLTDVLVEIDRGLRFIHWNRATERLLGIPASAAIGKSLRELFGNAEELVRAERIYRSVFEESQPKTFETEFDVQGQKLFLEINANPSTRGVSIVARDITERKLLETLMQKRFELMDYSAHHSFDDVLQKTIDIVSDLTGSHIGFIHFVGEDQTTIKRLTWSTETIRRLRTAEGAGLHYPVENAGVWADAVRNRVPAIHNDPETSPYPAETPARPAKVIREMVIPILRNEKIVAVMGVGNKAVDYSRQDIEIAERFADYAWDITERKQMESALAEERNQLAKRVEERTSDLSRANSNLARALRVKDEFLANMSHELRTPLNAILGLSESLGEQVAGPLNEKQQKYLSTINESGHHLLSLINDILDLAKIEAGQIALDINRVDVNSVCQASLRMIKQLAQKKNLEVRFEIDPDLGLMWADERRLKQMIVNLLSNAVKFTPEYSRIGLEVRGDKAANKVIITVWDTGIGIREEDLERLFKPFVQLDSGLAREAQGTGLGLALVAQMARLHGGSVHAISRPGEGSRFIVQLPWEPAMASDMAARLRNTGKFRAIDPRAKRPTILLIEDTREVVMMLIDYLEMVGYRMVTAQDGIDGLAQAKLSHPDLILMDIQMPRLDGFETTQKLRSDPEFKETPIIALTALAMPNDRQRCLDAGMDEYISKPVNLRALTKTIQKFLDRET